LRHELQKRGVRYFPKFPGYCAYFRTLLHLDSEKALDLFNQTVSIKEVNDLSVFLRTHMLERPEVSDKIAELRQNYDDLNKVYERIQRERKMLADLEPITSRANEYQIAAGKLGEWRKVAEELDGYLPVNTPPPSRSNHQGFARQGSRLAPQAAPGRRIQSRCR